MFLEDIASIMAALRTYNWVLTPMSIAEITCPASQWKSRQPASQNHLV